ncbi:hypothetical protein I2486_16065 [Cellulophaga sp. E16_2]|uniref:hypothetical protein n=1 Tax=Cellulophaga sp. E16_2 TaxID=2789297 RepID=UPI001A91CD9D|nr:hypothetical protein [Cellulophaga sp. E16_2]MBO0592920.1 hypothetical protein [Cellulophaga sp. E16_2]
MKTKNEIIDFINRTRKASLTISNTSYSKINKSKDVWWFNITTSKFSTPVNLLLQIEDGVFWIVLPVGFVNSIEKTFRIRQDKDAVDLEINAGSRNFLCDIKSGGTLFDFGAYIKEEVYF